jgi:hypothetical protein
MAGFAAQRLRPRRKGRRSPRGPRWHKSRDFLNASRFLLMVKYDADSLARFMRRFARLETAVHTLVRRHRDAIARVAAALLRHGELGWLEIEALVPLRRWPAHWKRPDLSLRREQK